MGRFVTLGLAVLAAVVSIAPAAQGAGNADVATLVESAPAGAFVAGWLVVVLVALLLAAGLLKRGNR
jgi:hypothetical protein